jgi:uncharacterized protein (TIGR02996 family)
MSEHKSFVRAILENPHDPQLRLIFADWLEERGDARGDFLRLEVELKGMAREDERYPALAARLEELRQLIGPKWLAVLDTPPIENCPPTNAGTIDLERELRMAELRFKFKCPKHWENLSPTGNSLIRFCGQCQRNVYYCSSVDEARQHAWNGDCVAVDSRLPRYFGDLEPYSIELGELRLEDPE